MSISDQWTTAWRWPVAVPNTLTPDLLVVIVYIKSSSLYIYRGAESVCGGVGCLGVLPAICTKSETLYHRDDALLYIAYVMLILAAPIPADRWHSSLWP